MIGIPARPSDLGSGRSALSVARGQFYPAASAPILEDALGLPGRFAGESYTRPHDIRDLM
jgi:hypothetical protein